MLHHNRRPNPDMDPAPDKAARDNRKTTKAARTATRRTDRVDDRKGRDWIEEQRRKDR